MLLICKIFLELLMLALSVMMVLVGVISKFLNELQSLNGFKFNFLVVILHCFKVVNQ